MRMWGNLFHFMSRASGGNPFSRTTFLIDFLIALTDFCWWVAALEPSIYKNIERCTLLPIELVLAVT